MNFSTFNSLSLISPGEDSDSSDAGFVDIEEDAPAKALRAPATSATKVKDKKSKKKKSHR